MVIMSMSAVSQPSFNLFALDDIGPTRTPAAAVPLQGVQAPCEGQQCKVERPHPASTTPLQALAARQWGRPQPPAQGQDPQRERAKAGLEFGSLWLSFLSLTP